MNKTKCCPKSYYPLYFNYLQKEHLYEKACGRLRLHSCVRCNLTTATAELFYKIMIVPLLTYSSKMKPSFTNSQLLKFVSIDRRAETFEILLL